MWPQRHGRKRQERDGAQAVRKREGMKGVVGLGERAVAHGRWSLEGETRCGGDRMMRGCEWSEETREPPGTGVGV